VRALEPKFLATPVEFSFTAYNEQLNGALVALGSPHWLRAGPGQVPPAGHAVPAGVTPSLRPRPPRCS